MVMLAQYKAQKKKLSHFAGFIELLEHNDFDKLLEFVSIDYLLRTKQLQVKKKTEQIKIPQEMRENITKNIFLGCFTSQFVGGGTAYSAIAELKEHAGDYQKIYDVLEDKRSKDTLQYVLYHKFFW